MYSESSGLAFFKGLGSIEWYNTAHAQRTARWGYGAWRIAPAPLCVDALVIS